MKTNVYVPRVFPHNAGLYGGNIAEHGVYDHLHLDIQVISEEVRAEVDRFVSSTDGRLTWQNFKRVCYEEIAVQLAKLSGSWVNEGLARLLSDPTCYGAPNAHLTAKFSGVPGGEHYREFLSLFERGAELMSRLPTTGYVESERVSFRVEFRAEPRMLRFDRQPTPCPVRNIQKVSLESLGRRFRTTEIHISFEQIHLVHPALLTDLFSQGFYTAFRLDEATGNYNVIATIQGFELEITQILVDMLRWLKTEVSEGGTGCSVVIKKEDITRFCVFGSDPKLQLVVAPCF